MSREVRRLPLDFSWPLNEVWEGYRFPEYLSGDSCPDCELGYAPQAQFFYDQWYGKVPFDPTSTGSTPFLPEGEEAQAWARRQIESSPEYYGTGPAALYREAVRITELWNGSWSHHLSQADVDALVTEERLWDFTRDFVPGTGWVEKTIPTVPTAAEVNSWSLFGFGHDSINAGVCIQSRAEREGVLYVCSTCGGTASVESYPGQQAEAEAWEAKKLPEGEGWQLWETTSEGSPITPVFDSPEAFARHLAANYRRLFNTDREPESYEALLNWAKTSGWAPTLAFEVTPHG